MALLCRRLVGRTAYVTGGGAGIGAAIARRLAGEGANVAVLDLNHPSAESVARSINEQHGPSSVCSAIVHSICRWWMNCALSAER